MTHKIDYESAYKAALEQNIREVRDAILIGDMSMRIKLANYSEKFGIPIRFLEHKILSDNLFANGFIKDPSKQSLHQKVAAQFIESINCVEDFEQLPAGGQNAKYICDDGIVRAQSPLIFTGFLTVIFIMLRTSILQKRAERKIISLKICNCF